MRWTYKYEYTGTSWSEGLWSFLKKIYSESSSSSLALVFSILHTRYAPSSFVHSFRPLAISYRFLYWFCPILTTNFFLNFQSWKPLLVGIKMLQVSLMSLQNQMIWRVCKSDHDRVVCVLNSKMINNSKNLQFIVYALTLMCYEFFSFWSLLGTLIR